MISANDNENCIVSASWELSSLFERPTLETLLLTVRFRNEVFILQSLETFVLGNMFNHSL